MTLNNSIKTQDMCYTTKIDVVLFLFILHLLFPGNVSAKRRQQPVLLRVLIETVVKKERLQLIWRELSVSEVDLFWLTGINYPPPPHIPPSPIPLE